MALSKLTVLISTFLLLPFALAAAHNTNETAVVEGMVYCLNCKYATYSSFTDAKPIPANVSIICKDYNNTTFFNKVYPTNPNGYFFAELQDLKMTHSLLDHPLHACTVKLYSSCQANCSVATNANSGLSGAPLRFENKVLHRDSHKIVIYAAGPLAYCPSDCPAN